jgi:polyisoprenyl-phosphate glycosyltransferase
MSLVPFMQVPVVMMISIVVPCYNEEACLGELHRRVSTAAGGLGEAYEIVLVNDGSRDQTWPIIQSLSATDSHVVGVNLSRNHGHELALSAGLSFARGTHILILDADLQDPPELMGDMLAKMADENADIVYGRRRSRAGESWVKKATSAAFYRTMQRLSEVEIPLDCGDFRMMTRRVLTVFLNMAETDRFVRGMISWVGFKQVPILYDRDARFAGETKYSYRKLFQLTLDALTGFSRAPLKIASHVGLWLGVAGVLMLGYSLYGWMSDKAVPGWTSLMSVIILLGSVQMFILGLIGEYLGRLYIQAKGRPLYVIESVVSMDATAQAAGDDLERRAAAHGLSWRAA